MRRIDINCDLGEGFGVYQFAAEESIYPLITSANVACGFHAGDPKTMRRALALAIRHQVAIGAHPGTPDLAGFGRRRMELTVEEIENICIYQIGALKGFAKALDTELGHVKPHGWLYSEAAGNLDVASAIARAVKAVSDKLVLFGLSGSQLIRAAQRVGLSFAHEGFIDRTYQSDGNLTPRHLPHALITEPEQAAQQALNLVQQGRVECLGGGSISVHVDTLCIHGDNPEVVNVLIRVRKRLLESGVEISPFMHKKAQF